MSFETSMLARTSAICAFAIWMVAARSPAESVVLYSETFDADLGTTVAVNDSAASNTWQFRDDCGANTLTGHSAPGSARWGDPTTCGSYGTQGSSDVLETPAIDLTSCPAAPGTALALTFNYVLSFQETSTYDRARIEALVGGGSPVVLADNGPGAGNPGLGNLVSLSSWSGLTLGLNDLLGTGSQLVIRFVAETSDGVANSDEGFFVDDVKLVCDSQPVDLALIQSARPDPVVPGQVLDYRITVTQNPVLSRAPVLYSTATSDDVGGPAFDFEDVSTIGTPIALADDQVGGAFPIGFDFPFYGVDRTEVFVSSNGFLTFLAGQPSGCCAGGRFPDPAAPNAVIAAWWEDLNPSAGGLIHFATRDLAPDRRFIVQFTGVPHYPGGRPVTFQVKLFERDGRIEIHYLDAPSDGGTHTAGIEDDTGEEAVPFFRGTTALETPLAVRFSPGTEEKATGVTVVDVLPAESIFSAALPSRGECATAGMVVGETVTCVLGDFEPGESATIDVTVTVPVGVERVLRNAVTVTADQLDPDPTDNTSVLDLMIEGSAIFADGFESGRLGAWDQVKSGLH